MYSGQAQLAKDQSWMFREVGRMVAELSLDRIRAVALDTCHIDSAADVLYSKREGFDRQDHTMLVDAD